MVVVVVVVVCEHAHVYVFAYVFMAHLMMSSVAQTTQQGTIAWLMNETEMINTDSRGLI